MLHGLTLEQAARWTKIDGPEPRDPRMIECHWCGKPWRAYRSTQKWCPSHSAAHMRPESERRR